MMTDMSYEELQLMMNTDFIRFVLDCWLLYLGYCFLFIAHFGGIYFLVMVALGVKRTNG